MVVDCLPATTACVDQMQIGQPASTTGPYIIPDCFGMRPWHPITLTADGQLPPGHYEIVYEARPAPANGTMIVAQHGRVVATVTYPSMAAWECKPLKTLHND